MTSWLVDTSALLRITSAPDADEWAARMERGEVSVTMITRLEVGFSARSGRDLRAEIERPPLAAMPIVHLSPAIENRAAEVQLLLADTGQHRAPSIADLLVAAAAETSEMTVLHLDKDFDLIAGITGQQVERLNVTA